jgi:hypothetical protein
MKSTHCLSLLLVIALELAGCVPAGSTMIPTQAKTLVSSPTVIAPTSTSTFTPSATITPTLPSTLEPEQAKETIRTLLQEPVDCAAPCFWGIMPGQTTLEEAANIFIHLGLGLKGTTTLDGKDFYDANYNSHDGIEVSPVIALQNNVVKSLDVGINDTSPEESPRKWSAYSPETLIKRYGPPSRVDFFLGRVAPTPIHSMVLYFENVALIVEYGGTNILNVNSGTKLEICPLTNKVDFIKIWMGNDPQYPPSPGVPLEESTSLTAEEFSNLMTGDPIKACFNLKEEAFPR